MDIRCSGLVDRRGRNVRPRLRRHGELNLRAIVLHQTQGPSFDNARNQRWLNARGQGEHRVDQISAHFVVLQNGVIYYTHDVGLYRSGSAGRNQGIDIEFAGRFTHSNTPNESNRVPHEMLRAGRKLVRALVEQIATITHIHPHGQVQSENMDGSQCGGTGSTNPCGKLESCPGPDIWMNIGHWACGRPLDGGLGLVCNPPLAGMGYPIRDINSGQANPEYIVSDL